MTCCLITIEWLLYLALSADSRIELDVIELSTIRSDLLTQAELAILAVTSG
jgi:hypothetical protein